MSIHRIVLTLAAFLGFLNALPACPFCTSTGTTLTQDVSSAALVLHGRLGEPKFDPRSANAGSTELFIDTVIKSHSVLGKQKSIVIPKYLPQVDPAQPMKCIAFGDVFRGKIDIYRNIAVKPDSNMPQYLQEAMEVKDKDSATRLKFFFKYLDDPDLDVANDAYMEYGNAEYKDFRIMAEHLPAATIIQWLKNPATPVSRFGLYGSMLGHCGKPEDAKILRDMLEDPNRKYTAGIDGILAGYVLLKKSDGWTYLADLLKNEKTDFMVRYAGLKAVRFLWDYRTDEVPPEKLADAVASLVHQPDISDLAIEELRKRNHWSKADMVLDLFDKPSHELPIIQRSILRYALACPASASKRAVQFITDQRKKDPKRIEEMEDLMRSETVIGGEAAGK